MLHYIQAALVAAALAPTLLFAQQNPNQPKAGVSHVTPGEPAPKGIFTPSPWFADPAVRQNLNINEKQFGTLNQMWSDSYRRYRLALGNVDTLKDAERIERMRELSGNAITDFQRSSNQVLSPEQLQRFNQLYLQYRLYDAFTDPQVQQQLRLTDQQRARFRELGQRYNQQLIDAYKNAHTDRTGAVRQFETLQQQNSNQIGTVLNPQQQQQWRAMTGAPFMFPPNFNPDQPNR
jgi:hypothetical protein